MFLVVSYQNYHWIRKLNFVKEISQFFNVTGAMTYKWSDGNESDCIVLNEKREYNVIGTSRACCKDILHFTASYFGPLTYSILSDKDEVTSDRPLHLWSEKYHILSSIMGFWRWKCRCRSGFITQFWCF